MSMSERRSGTSVYSWKISAVLSAATVIGAAVSFGDVSPIVTGLMLLAAIGWAFTARDNRRALEKSDA